MSENMTAFISAETECIVISHTELLAQLCQLYTAVSENCKHIIMIIAHRHSLSSSLISVPVLIGQKVLTNRSSDFLHDVPELRKQ